ncbi:hypothetical protein AMS68_007269 [Peltaster fructicola]|uniref:BTB domain-containing protein n=1 Tax=Peltaster fructicola TaxID=286661 RepID=A0A6H0Y400_9PEZI|nr:hypothetical protein AMS68_007269 [Peltaster fructicola]
MTEPREKQLHELLSRDMVDIYVGSENTHWILHEKLLCYRSHFFSKVFYNKEGRKNSSFGLPEEDDRSFKLFVGWLYSESVPHATEEKELGPLLDLYLMGEKWEIKKLVVDVLDVVRKYYHDTDTWPGLRRVQYIYSNTDVESPMRQLVVSCVARMLVLGDGIPAHWDGALKRNGQLAVDIIMAVQRWKLSGGTVPDARDEPVLPIMKESQEKKSLKEGLDQLPGADLADKSEVTDHTEGEETAVEEEL